jgi:hypothetical protein
LHEGKRIPCGDDKQKASSGEAVAGFVFFAGAAGAFIVAVDLFAGAVRGGGFGLVATGLASALEFTFFFLLELAFESVDGGGGSAGGDDGRELRGGWGLELGLRLGGLGGG